MKATSQIKDVFYEKDTNILNVSECGLDDGYLDITHVVLDGNNLVLYSGNPELDDNFQDDDYEQAYLEDDDDRWNDIINCILSM